MWPDITVQTTGRCGICDETVCSPDATVTRRLIDCKTGYECGTCRGLLEATWVCIECLLTSNADAEFIGPSNDAISWECPECEQTEVIDIER